MIGVIGSAAQLKPSCCCYPRTSCVTYLHTCMYACKHTHAYMHTRNHATHAYMHTYGRMYMHADIHESFEHAKLVCSCTDAVDRHNGCSAWRAPSPDSISFPVRRTASYEAKVSTMPRPFKRLKEQHPCCISRLHFDLRSFKYVGLAGVAAAAAKV